MNQTPATILILSSAIFAHAGQSSAVTNGSQSWAVVLGISAVALGLAGVVSLLNSLNRERELLIDNKARLDVFNRLFVRDRSTVKTEKPRSSSESDLELSPEIQSQLNLVADMEGRDSGEVLEETLKRHLPKYTKPRVA